MHFILGIEDGCLKAELFNRETVEETREFLRATTAAGIEHGCTRALIVVHSSRPIFRVEQYNLSAYIKGLAAAPEARVALVATDDETYAAHGYIEVLARQQGANVRSFRTETEALKWLRG